MSDHASGGSIDREPSLELQISEVAEPTVFSVLAERARGHPPAHLWGATLFGAADALAIMFAYPAAWALASAALTLSAYGIWGLADEALVEDALHRHGLGARVVLRIVRAGAVVGGTVAVLVAAFGLTALALGRLIS
jgi:hypothetical protein